MIRLERDLNTMLSVALVIVAIWLAVALAAPDTSGNTTAGGVASQMTTTQPDAVLRPSTTQIVRGSSADRKSAPRQQSKARVSSARARRARAAQRRPRASTMSRPGSTETFLFGIPALDEMGR